MRKETDISLKVKLKDIDLYIEKANQYVELLKEAKTLAEELASVKLEVEINRN